MYISLICEKLFYFLIFSQLIFFIKLVSLWLFQVFVTMLLDMHRDSNDTIRQRVLRKLTFQTVCTHYNVLTGHTDLFNYVTLNNTCYVRTGNRNIAESF